MNVRQYKKPRKALLKFLSCVVAFTLLLPGIFMAASGAEAATGALSGQTYTGLNSGSRPGSIALGPDGNLWFTDAGLPTPTIGKVVSGQVYEYPSGLQNDSNPYSITPGPSGSNTLWFTDAGDTPAIGKITTSGTIVEYTSGLNSGSFPNNITLGPDGNLWFTDGGFTPAIGMVNSVSGQIYEYTVDNGIWPFGIASGPDGHLWFTDPLSGMIGSLDPTTTPKAINEYANGLNGGSLPADITAGPDGNLWFTDVGATPAIGKITPSGTIVEYTSGLNSGSKPNGITIGSDGNLWFTDGGSTPAIGRVSPATGAIIEYAISSGSYPTGITRDSSGNLWYSIANNAQPAIGEIQTANYTNAYQLTGLNPSSGVTSGGTPVIISGDQLSTVSAVYFGSTPVSVSGAAYNSSTGTIAISTPAMSRTGSVQVAVYSSVYGLSNSIPFSYYINPLSLNATSTVLPTGNVGATYSSQTITAYVYASGGTGTGYIYSIAGLPGGLSFNNNMISGNPTVSVVSTLTVTVTDSAGNAAHCPLSLNINQAYYIGGGGGGGGGPAPAATQTTTTPTTTPPTNSATTPTTSTASVFSDVSASFWGYNIITSLSSRGIVSGYPDGAFKPNAAITRAEFATMLVKALGLNTTGTTGAFTDVSAGAWYYGAVNAAVTAGLVSGRGNNLFEPEALITRQEMAVMVAKALGTKTLATNGAELNAFKDGSRVSSWATSGVDEAVKAGIVIGMSANQLAPTAHATRAQAAAMLYQMLNFLGK